MVMKKLFTVILAVVASVGIANAESKDYVYAEVDGLRYTIDYPKYLEASVHWWSNPVYGHNYGQTRIDVPEKVYYDYTNYTVRLLTAGAFENSWNLEIVTLPNSVRGIYAYAFNACPSLKSVTLSQSLDSIGSRAFGYCTSLDSVVIPDHTSIIRENIFQSCTSLKTIHLGTGLTFLPNEAFAQCTALDTIVIPDNIKEVGERVFTGCSSLKSITLGSGVTTLSKEALANLTALESIVIPDNITTIDVNVFSGDSALRHVTWGTGISSIPMGAFRNCTSLDTLELPAHITEIQELAYTNCESLTSIIIPENITSIQQDAFHDCANLKEVTINSNVLVNAPQWKIYNAIYNKFGEQVTHYILGDSISSIADSTFFGCSNLEKVTFGPKVQTIGKGAFANCTSLETFMMPTSIADSTFVGCDNLREMILGSNAKTIGKGAFANCSSLESITISEGVEQIDAGAFAGCTNLKTVIINSPAIFNQTFTESRSLKDIFGEQVTTYVLGDSITTIGGYTFAGCANLTNVIIGKNVKTIQNYAFRNWTGCTSITIPEQIEQIGGYVFYGCTNLRTVYWNAINCREQYTSNYMFQGIATQIDTIYLGENVEYITETLFAGMTQLTSFTLPAHIKGIRDYAFKDCTFTKVYISDLSAWCQLELGHNPLDIASELYLNGELVEGELILPTDITTVANKVFKGYPLITSLIILDNITTLGDSFRGTKLHTVTVGSGVTSMNSTFADCDSLKTVYMNATSLQGTFNSIFGNQVTNYILGDNITAIGDGWFYGCNNLSSITIPDGVTTIGSQAFMECDGLTQITLPEALTTIGYYAFYGCSGITEIVIPDNVTIIRERAFENCNLNKITIGESVDSIGDKAFSGCPFTTIVWKAKNVGDFKKDDTPFYWKINNIYPYERTQYITSFTFDKTVEHIPSYLCQEMTGLTELTLSEGLISVGDSAFTRIGNITTLDIPSSVTTLGKYAFGGFYNLTSVYCHAKNPPTMNADKWAFHDNCVYNCTLYVQQSSLNAYKAADGWKKFLSFATIPDEEQQGIEDLQADGDKPVKVLHEGQIYILRGEKVYTMTGQEVR